jgi:hypothetical protein
MPYLREAVEKKRQYYIESLVNMGIYENSDDRIQAMTFTELQGIYLQHKKAPNQKPSNGSTRSSGIV